MGLDKITELCYNKGTLKKGDVQMNEVCEFCGTEMEPGQLICEWEFCEDPRVANQYNEEELD